MWKYIFGTKHIIGGSYSPSEGHKHFYRTTYPWFYWKLWIPTIRVGRRTSKGMYLQYNSRFWMFFWKPLCDGYYDSNVWHKSKQFQYLTFSLGSIEPKKGNNMNEIMEPADFSPLVDLVEILDADGNPTGQYRPSETPQEGSTKYTTAEDGEHEVVLN